VASLLRAGTTLADALATGRDETDSFELAGPLGVITERVRQGSTLGAALNDMVEFFSEEELRAIEEAERAGELPRALDELR
jgi:type II secretory pathway component PulF